MSIVRYVSHPQVRISADVPVPRWGLSDLGRARAEAMCRQPWIDEVGRIVSSQETKALETASIVAAATGVSVEVRVDTHENDRSGTGFVPAERFEELADAFFADPERSVEGWERAVDAQSRIVGATADLFAGDPDGDVMIVGHGGVGTLLLCHHLGVDIDRAEDQNGGDAAPGGGNVWAFDRSRRAVVHRWRPIDTD